MEWVPRGSISSDAHLNLFGKYDVPFGTPDYENNVTHALINTLRLSDPRLTREFLVQLVPALQTEPIDWTDIDWQLQRPPPRSLQGFRKRVVLGISLDGRDPLAKAGLGEGDGIPDAWIYTRSSDHLCVLIEIKTRGCIDLDQIKRHVNTHFGANGADLVEPGLRWSDVSRAMHSAYNRYPNVVAAELLTFLSQQGLSATLVFDDATVHFSKGKLPKDVMDRLASALRERFQLKDDELVTYLPEWPHVLIFRNFQSVGNIEVWLKGDPPNVNVLTLLSFGTATAQDGFNLLTMPVQIDRLLEKLGDQGIVAKFLEFLPHIKRIDSDPVWTLLDRPIRFQAMDWNSRSSEEIYTLLKAARRDVDQAARENFGEDHQIPALDLDRVKSGLRILHRTDEIAEGDWKGYRIFARAYLGNAQVSAYGRSPQDIIPQILEHCALWYQLLLILSGAS